MTDPELDYPAEDPPDTPITSQNWVFSESELAAGLRRNSGDPTLAITQIRLAITQIREREITQRLPAVGRLRGLRVNTDGTNGKQSFNLVLKETHGSTRVGAAGAGLREVSIYLTLKEHLPVRLPTLIAAHPKGEWLIMIHLPPGRRPDKWQAADYLLAADQLAILHDRFWGLEDLLATYSWLESPLQSDRDIYLQAAIQNAKKLANSESPLLSQQTQLLEVTKQIIDQVDTIIEGLLAFPSTLLHGDYWPGNINIHPNQGLTVFDWEDAAIGPAVFDLLSFIQGSSWHFAPLPLSSDEIISHYLNRLATTGGRTLDQEEFQFQWDCAVMWTFINGWVSRLAKLPDSLLGMRLPALEVSLFQPLQQAAHRQLK
jgi:hypothetical protein